MEDTAHRAIAIVGVGAILPEAPNVQSFWKNITSGRYCISEVSPDRWNPEFYYDADHGAPDKTYSKIGGWVREFSWEPMKWKLPIPPRVAQAMDEAQQWGLACTREALEDFGYPGRFFDPERTAVILGNAMAGEKHYMTALRVAFPEYAHELAESASFASLPKSVQEQIIRELHGRIEKRLPAITEDSMPGELANCLAGRIANIFNLHGPNFTADAACASTMAALTAAMHGLADGEFDVAIAGGIDRNMGASTFVKFCKIGALSATGSRPFAEGADGFVMGEGAALFVLKRLGDAEKDGDRIYAVLRGIGGASDGKGKGITAPNPFGQRLAVERAWKNAGLSPATIGLIEGHGTSTKVGDVVEVQSMLDVLKDCGVQEQSIALGSVKSNIGHLKAAAGAAGLLKAALSLYYKVLPPSVNCPHTNPELDFVHSPLYVNTELRPWEIREESVRRAGLSAFGFGGTNFHLVMEEHIPGRLTGKGKRRVSVVSDFPSPIPPVASANDGQVPTSVRIDFASTGAVSMEREYKVPLRGALVIGAETLANLSERLQKVHKNADAGAAPAFQAPMQRDLDAPERIAIDYGNAAELAERCSKALKAIVADVPPVWKALRAQGVFRGSGTRTKVAFLYTGQGSQYVNMVAGLREAESIVAKTFEEADQVLTPLLGKPLTEYIFSGTDPTAIAQAEEALKQTAITQPAVIATDVAITRLLAAYGITPDMTMGHSVGEYGALVASGALPFEDAMEAVSARGREMTTVALEDNGRMAAIFAPLNVIEETLKTIDGYVVIANVNSISQSVIGGSIEAVERAINIFIQGGYNAVPLPVSHAFHTSIVAPASEPLKRMLQRLRLCAPRLPIVANITGQFYPTGSDLRNEMIEMLAQQVASPVQFVKGLQTLYDAGARVFVECGPKKALQGFADDVLGGNGDVVSLFTNHPKLVDITAFNQALCGLYAAGLGRGLVEETREVKVMTESIPAAPCAKQFMLDDASEGETEHSLSDKNSKVPVVISGAALGLPGTEHIFDDANVTRILEGETFIHTIPTQIRHALLDKNITRLVKDDNGGTFEAINKVEDVIKLAGRGGVMDLVKEYGISDERAAAFDRVTCLAIAAGIDALRDAGIPLVMRYKTTSKGTHLPDRWVLPESMQDDTGIVFASAFPGYDAFVDELTRYYEDCARRDKLVTLESLMERTDGSSEMAHELRQQIKDLRIEIETKRYKFDRRFMFRVLAMGHSQFAELIGARGPNVQLNSACASTAQAVAVAEDWIRSGRCRRVIVIAADDVTSDHLLEWMGAGFLAAGAAATDEKVEDAAIPFDRRRHGMIVGMGAASLVVESAQAVNERGMQPICEVLSTATANSAYHGTRLDVEHICSVMEDLVARAEAAIGVPRSEFAKKMVFVSHETYTPARGGSASAEIQALRRVFGDLADDIIIANTKGFTGHAMGAGIEDVIALKALETSLVPPVPNFKEEDPELGHLNLSKGGSYPIEYALRLAAGFGSQISMLLMRWVPAKDGSHQRTNELGYAYRVTDTGTWKLWLSGISHEATADLEVVNRTLRVCDTRASAVVREMFNSLGATAAMSTQQQTPTASIRDKSSEPVTLPSTTLAEIATKQSKIAEPVTESSVRERVLALVAEKTGYPVDMLDLDLDLEADLGVDTVKQAEVFSTVREAYGISRDDQIKLRDFPTLAHVIRFVMDRNTKATTTESEVVPVPTGETIVAIADAPVISPRTEDAIREKVLEIVAEKTGYPKDMLDLDLDLEADLGVDTVKQAEMFVAVRIAYNIPRDENLKLRDFPTLNHVIRFALERQAGAKQTQVAAQAVVAALPVPAREGDVTHEMPPNISAVSALLHTEEAIREKVLEIVAEKTGYPKDMLDLDLDLEADLGVDTVKQAEMFVAVRAAYDIPRDEALKLRDFPTLNHVIRFAIDRQAGAAKTREADTYASVKSAATKIVPAVSIPVRRPNLDLASFDAADKVPRRVPVPVPRPPLDICKVSGVKLTQGSRVVLMPDEGGVADALAQRLQALRVDVLRLDAAAETDAIVRQLKSWAAAGPIEGVYWLPALDHEGELLEMDLRHWREALRRRVKALYMTMKTLYDRVTFLVSATALGGQHGYDKAGATSPLGGSVVGMTKTYKREREAVQVKAVDFQRSRAPKEVAEILIQETLRDPGVVEVGYKDNERWGVGLQEQAVADGNPGMTLDSNSVFLVTGAAGSIVSAITADLASASGGTFYLLDLVPEPNPNNPDLSRFVSDKEGLKRDIFNRIQSRGVRATPALVERELAALERAQAALSSINAVRSAGGTAHYFSVNLTDDIAVARVIEQVRVRSGHIDVLLHAAGMERSHYLPDKDPREFDLVFDVKSDGWFNLLRAIGNMPLKATVCFSSIAGRFGNAGQADYSSANDLLCKITSCFRTIRPNTRGIVIDWTAWGGIGMASRGSIPKMMELAGIDMLPPEAGIPYIRRELTCGAARGEVVVGERLGILLKEFDETGGLDSNISAKLLDQRPVGPMISNITNMSLYSGLTLEVNLDPSAQGFLHDHQIDRTPVLPGVMGIESFAEAAQFALPGWHIECVEDVKFLAPFKFYRNQPRTVTINAVIRQQGDAVIADCKLLGSRLLLKKPEPEVQTHFTGRVRLAKREHVQTPSALFAVPVGPCVTAADIYKIYFHGPAYQVLNRAWRTGDSIVGEMSQNLPPNHQPPHKPILFAPRLIELCFQTAGLWEISMENRMGLPLQIESVRLLRNPQESVGPLYAVITPRRNGEIFDGKVVDVAGCVFMELEGYKTVALPNTVSSEPLEALRDAVAA